MSAAHSRHPAHKTVRDLRPHQHACLIYDTEEEQLAVVIPYILGGLAKGERCLYVADANRVPIIRAALSAADPTIQHALASNALVVAPAQETCLVDGVFNLDEMIRRLSQASQETRLLGYGALRITGEFPESADPNALVVMQAEYTLRLSSFFKENDALGICQYRKSALPPELILQVIHSHPLVIYRGEVCGNFYYIPPAEHQSHEQAATRANRFLDNLLSSEKQALELSSSTARLAKVNRSLQKEIAERERAEKALIESSALIRMITDAVPAGIAYVDRSLRYQFANRLYEELPKVKIGSIVGRQAQEVLGDEYFELVRPHVERVLSGISVSFELDEPLSRGRNSRHLAVSYIPHIENGGEVRGFFVLILDISEQKRANDALRASEKRFLQMLEDLQLVAVMLDRDGNITLCNSFMLQLTGWRREDVIGRSWFDMFIPPTLPEVREMFLKTIASGHCPTHYENPIITRKGELRIILWNNTFLRDSDGKITGAASIGEDITDRKKAEEALRSSEETYRLLFESNPHPMWVYDLKTLAFLEVNEAAIQHYGYTRKKFLSMTIKDIRPKDDVAALQDRVASLPSGINKSGIWRHCKRDGTIIFVELTSHSIKFGERSARLVLANDVTERIRAEEAVHRLQEDLELNVRQRTSQLEASNRELEGFCYAVSHDLRAPLARLEGFSRALLEDNGDQLDEQGKLYAERIRFSSHQLRQLIDALLDLSQLTRSTIISHKVDLSKIAWNIAEELQKMHPDRQVKFIIALNVVVNGDQRLLRVLMENLLGNSWKFTEHHQTGAIEFGMTVRNREKIYFVRDDGAGFDMKYADKLFTPFQRLHSPDEFVGTGIGLATVQRIVQRHGGKIWAEGAVEKGATFFFTL